MDPAVAELYLKKSVEVTWSGRRVVLDIPVDVFSSFQVDRGTQLLLRTLAQRQPSWGRVLDLGCGYGPIALHLSTLGLAEDVHAIDRDALAALFTQRNAERNQAHNVLARGGLAYDDAPAPLYDAIVSNLPAKAGEPVHRLMLLGAAERLAEDGEVWVVVVLPLEESIDAILADPAVQLRGKVRGKQHVVYHYAFAGQPTLPADPYARSIQPFRWGELAYSVTAFFGLPEFDTLSRATEAVLSHASDVLADARLRRIAVWNPGQGHVPILLARLFGSIDAMTLVSRDLLALRAARRNLASNGFRGQLVEHHAAGPTAPEHDAPDLIVGTLSEGEGVAIGVEKLRQARLRHPGVPVLMGCSTSFGARVARGLKKRGLRASARKKRGAASSILCGQGEFHGGLSGCGPDP